MSLRGVDDFHEKYAGADLSTDVEGIEPRFRHIYFPSDYGIGVCKQRFLLSFIVIVHLHAAFRFIVIQIYCNALIRVRRTGKYISTNVQYAQKSNI